MRDGLIFMGVVVAVGAGAWWWSTRKVPTLGSDATVTGADGSEVPAYLSNDTDRATSAALGDGWSWDAGNTGIAGGYDGGFAP